MSNCGICTKRNGWLRSLNKEKTSLTLCTKTIFLYMYTTYFPCKYNCFLLGFSSPVNCLHTTVDFCTFQLLSQTDAQELLRQICTSPSLIVQPPASRTSPCVQVNSAGKCIRIASQISSRCFVQCSKQILYYI